MMKITVSVKGLDVVQRNFERMRRDMHAKVLEPAINKVAAKAVAEINRAIPQEYAVRAGEVRNAVNLRRARSGQLEAVIEIFGSARKRGRSLNLIHCLAYNMRRVMSILGISEMLNAMRLMRA